jgi:hypothetical protein
MCAVLSLVNRQCSIVNAPQSIPVDEIFVSDLLKRCQLRLPFTTEFIHRTATRDRVTNLRSAAQTVEVRRPPLEAVRVESEKLIDDSNAGIVRFERVPIRDDDSDPIAHLTLMFRACGRETGGLESHP